MGMHSLVCAKQEDVDVETPEPSVLWSKLDIKLALAGRSALPSRVLEAHGLHYTQGDEA